MLIICESSDASMIRWIYGEDTLPQSTKYTSKN